MLSRPPLAESVMGNVSFDTRVYHQPGIDLLFTVIDPGRILFGSEMIGAVRSIDPQTGCHFDTAATSTPSDCLPRSGNRFTNSPPDGSTRASARSKTDRLRARPVPAADAPGGADGPGR
jgi:hypothetical protein